MRERLLLLALLALAGGLLVAPADAGATTIVARHSGMCLDVPEASRDNVALQQWPCNGGANQEWDLREAGDGTVTVVSRASGKCFDVERESRHDFAKIKPFRCHGKDNQRFALQTDDGRHYRLVAKHSGKCVDVEGGSRKRGASIIQWTCYGGQNQQFVLSTTGPGVAKSTAPPPTGTPPLAAPPVATPPVAKAPVAAPPPTTPPTARAARLKRTLCIIPSARSTPPPGPSDLLAAFDAIHAAGARGTYAAWTWKALEPSREDYRPLDEFAQNLRFLAQRFNVYLSVQVINTTVKETPSDLRQVPWDDPKMIARFQSFLDALLPRLPPQVKTLSIGTEVDVYFVRHGEREAFLKFFTEAAAHVRSKAPALLVGTTFTFEETVGPRAEGLKAFVSASDVAMITYYALGDGFRPRGPDAPVTDVPRMLAFATGKPLVLEVGYASSPALGSSEEAQASFLRQAFKAWQAAGDRIPVLNVYSLHDENPETCRKQARYYGGPDDERFRAFLCSVGVKRTDGAPKAAWNVILEQARAGR